ncbi:hypothetical protein [Actinophytocola sediminis]
MPADPITDGLLRHLEQHGQDRALRELGRELRAGRLSPREAARTYAEPLATLADRAMANRRTLDEDDLRRHQEQAVAFWEPPAPARPRPPDPDEDAWADRSVFD